MDADIYYDEMGKDMRVEEIPADMLELAQEYRAKLLDAVAEHRRRDHGVGAWKEKDVTSGYDPQGCIRKGTIANKLVPVTCGTSYRNKGVQKLLDAIVDYMPAPTGHPGHQGYQSRDR